MAPLEVLLEVRAVAAWMLVLRLAQIANALVKGSGRRVNAPDQSGNTSCFQFAAAFLFDVAQLHTQGHELFEVAVFACERLFVSASAFFSVLICDSSCQGRFVGLPLEQTTGQGNDARSRSRWS